MYHDNLNIFIEGATRLINTHQGYATENVIFGTALHVNRGKRFDLVRGNVTNPSYPNGYVYARIEHATGNIYSQSGKKVRGSIYSARSGLECVGRNGVIID
jgi:hypothetical protein